MFWPLVLAVMLLAFALWPVRIVAVYTWRGYHSLTLTASFLGFLRCSRDFSPGRRKKSRKGRDPFPVLRYLRQHVRWKGLTAATRVGLGDAAATAIAAGSLWGIQGALSATFAGCLGIPPRVIRLEVRPEFTRRILEVKIIASLQVRLGYLLVAALRFYGAAAMDALRKRTGRPMPGMV